MIYIYIIDNHPEVDRDRILIFQNSPLSSGNHPEHSIQEEAAAAAAAAAAAQEEETGWAAAVSHATDVPTGAWKKHKFNAYIGNRWDLYGFFVAAWSWRLCRGMFFFPNCTQTWPIWSDPMLEVRNLNGHNDMVSRKLNGFWLPCDSSRDQTCGVWVWYLRGSSYSSGLMWTSRHLAQAKNSVEIQSKASYPLVN